MVMMQRLQRVTLTVIREAFRVIDEDQDGDIVAQNLLRTTRKLGAIDIEEAEVIEVGDAVCRVVSR